MRSHTWKTSGESDSDKSSSDESSSEADISPVGYKPIRPNSLTLDLTQQMIARKKRRYSLDSSSEEESPNHNKKATHRHTHGNLEHSHTRPDSSQFELPKSKISQARPNENSKHKLIIDKERLSGINSSRAVSCYRCTVI
ncbi:unnamed protein product [Blepharisma stoltei]|uniref:Uncharacterized protein n=1 Tax=Blepharisma stoltei TaxID=1481888 RepID=A0AAU9IH77_9CILI|nr:unnamed protein product [Blepharisma stoltei]